jgi:hypothetical protein
MGERKLLKHAHDSPSLCFTILSKVPVSIASHRITSQQFSLSPHLIAISREWELGQNYLVWSIDGKVSFLGSVTFRQRGVIDVSHVE